MGTTKIEWADAVWNPATGCSKVSEGCRNCYAERMARRFWGGREFWQVQMHPERLLEPLGWRKPRRVFVASMGDLFHGDIKDTFVAHVFAVMVLAHRHTFFVLTKRNEGMMRWFSRQGETAEEMVLSYVKPLIPNAIPGLPEWRWPLPNVWMGVSVENQKAAERRIPDLMAIPAAGRFVSCEPLLGEVDLRAWLRDLRSYNGPGEPDGVSEGLDWVICGGESGPGARPMHPDWARGLRDQCQAVGTPFFFKQWGEWKPVTPLYPENDEDETRLDDVDLEAHQITYGNGGTLYQEDYGLKEYYWCGYQPDPGQNPWIFERTGKKAAGRLLDGREWNEKP